MMEQSILRWMRSRHVNADGGASLVEGGRRDIIIFGVALLLIIAFFVVILYGIAVISSTYKAIQNWKTARERRAMRKEATKAEIRVVRSETAPPAEPSS